MAQIASLAFRACPFLPNMADERVTRSPSLVLWNAWDMAASIMGWLSALSDMWTVEVPLVALGPTIRKRDSSLVFVTVTGLAQTRSLRQTSGSDAFGITTVLQRQSDRYVLNGQKVFVTNGVIADLTVTFA